MFSQTLKPSLEEVLAAPTDASIPVWRALPSDTETPISAFLKLRRGGTGFLLESAEQDGSLGRYSFIGVVPDAVLRADLDRGTVETQSGIASYEASPIEALRQLVGNAPVHQIGNELPGFVGGAVGALGFDLVRSIEKLPSLLPDPNPFPAAVFARYATTLVFDHLKQRLLRSRRWVAPSSPINCCSTLRRRPTMTRSWKLWPGPGSMSGPVTRSRWC